MSIHSAHHLVNTEDLNDNITSIIENGLYLNRNLLSVKEVVNKIQEFSSFLNGPCRLLLLKKFDRSDNELLIHVLVKLKKDLKNAMGSIGKSLNNKSKTVTCNVCDKRIEIGPSVDFWNCIQNHEHFEELLSNENLKDSISVSDSCDNTTPLTSTTSKSLLARNHIKVKIQPSNEFKFNFSNNTNKDDAIPSTSSSPSGLLQNGITNNQSKDGGFKFNFGNHEKSIESKLYPDFLKQVSTKYDKLSECTFQRCGNNRAKCLICPCELFGKGKGKMSSFHIVSHAVGKNHSRMLSDQRRIDSLLKYHNFWKRQEDWCQYHQIYFVPYITTVWCNICNKHVEYRNVVNHISIESKHKNKITRFLQSSDCLDLDPQLLDKQAEYYGITRYKKVSSDENYSKSKTSSEKQCLIIKKPLLEQNIEDFIPQRFKEHIIFFKKTKNKCRCLICNTDLNLNRIDIKAHILNDIHIKSSGKPIKKYNYYCVICNQYVEDEFKWEEHLGTVSHEKIKSLQKESFSEYECTTCLTVFYGDETSIMRHISAINKRRKKEIKLPHSVIRLFESIDGIENDGNLLKTEANIVLNKNRTTMECCKCLEESISEIYPNCQAYPFGSRINGLGNNRSDLDIFMDIGNMYTGERNQSPQEQENFVNKCKNLFKKQRDDFKKVIGIPSARTPIVKLHHIYTQLDCDISFRHGLGVENTKFLRFCIDLQPITQPFILLLKQWSNCCKLNEHITNYGLALMAIFYLQVNGYLLPVGRLRTFNKTAPLIIDGWETINYSVPVEILRDYVDTYQDNLKDLLQNFFFYYSQFNYASDVVCPLLGYTVPKSAFTDKCDDLPIEMESYRRRVLSGKGELFRALSEFCLQDPFDLSHNLTKACQSGTIKKLKILCQLTYEHLKSIN